MLTWQLTRTGNEGVALRSQTAEGTAIKVVHALDDLGELSSCWDALAAKSGGAMQDLTWIRACASTFAPNGRLHVIVAGKPPHVTAIAPLLRQRNGFDRLELLGVNETYEPMDFLFMNPSALVPLAQSLARSKTPLWLKRIPAGSPVVDALRRAYRWRSVVICLPAPGYPYIPLHDGWILPERQLSRSRREYLKRAQRIAEHMGTVRCEVLSPKPDELGPLLEEAFRVEAAGWKGRSGSALAHDALQGTFYRQYAAEASRKGILRLCLLRIGANIAAMQLAVEYGNRFWLHKIGYDETFARCSPGTLLVRETVRYAAERGLCSYEFLGTAQPWIRMWTAHIHPCISLLAYPASRNGLAAFVTDIVMTARRRLGGIA
jgi:CelD/BcsL family acetyltransferase involved in cellulose biosynthesis